MDRSNLFSRGSTPPIPSKFPPSNIESLFQSIPPDHTLIDNTFEVAADDQSAADRQSALLFSIGTTARQPQPQSQPQQPSQQPSQPSQQPSQSSQPSQPSQQPSQLSQQPTQPSAQPSTQPSLQSSQQPSQPQQAPTPPGSSQRSNASPPQTDTQQKLLEQLMSGSVFRVSILSSRMLIAFCNTQNIFSYNELLRTTKN